MKARLNIFLFLFATFTLNACKDSHKTQPNSTQNLKPEFQSIIDSVNVKGSVLIYDLKQDNYYSNDFNWAKTARLPASTFKIPNLIIALELGIVENENTLSKWDGEERYLKLWEQDLTLKQAFSYSCVPCYQKIARKIGSDRMNKFLEKIRFGQMLVDENTVDNFWLIGDSVINQFQQIDFLKRFYLSELPLSKSTVDTMKKIMVVKETEDFTIRAKTGLSVISGKYNGWYVGYIERKDNVYFFATNISPSSTYDTKFNNLRKLITYEALKELNFF